MNSLNRCIAPGEIKEMKKINSNQHQQQQKSRARWTQCKILPEFQRRTKANTSQIVLQNKN